MKNLFIILLLGFGSYQLWQKYSSRAAVEPIYQEQYVAVYGRNNCSYTKKMLHDLEQSGVNYHYYIIDNKEVADFIHPRMQAYGISTRRYYLPVVDTNGSIAVRPDLQEVLADYYD